MNHVILTASAVLVVLLVLPLCREVRQRRGLQALLKKLLSRRNRNAEGPDRRSEALDAGG